MLNTIMNYSRGGIDYAVLGDENGNTTFIKCNGGDFNCFNGSPDWYAPYDDMIAQIMAKTQDGDETFVDYIEPNILKDLCSNFKTWSNGDLNKLKTFLEKIQITFNDYVKYAGGNN